MKQSRDIFSGFVIYNTEEDIVTFKGFLLIVFLMFCFVLIQAKLYPQQSDVAEWTGYTEMRIDYSLILDKTIDAVYLNPIVPADFITITSPYGKRKNPLKVNTGGKGITRHAGVDMVGFPYARIQSVADGVVIEHWLPEGWHGGVWFRGHDIFDGLVVILHDDGRISLYGHLGETYVYEGMRVTAGTVIGRQGSGGVSTGPHLHYELRNLMEQPIQPLRYIDYSGWEL